MLKERRSERLEVTFELPNGEGFVITAYLGHSDETDRYVTALMKELDRAGQAFSTSQHSAGAAKVWLR